MIINPYRGILLENKYFGYDTSSFRENLKLRNEVYSTQTSRTTTVLGKDKETFTMTLALDSTYNVYAGASFVGSTTWVGVSRFSDFKTFVGAVGVSMPLTFVAPYGVTYSVIPTGQLDFSIFNPENPSDSVSGTEFRVSLTLETI